MAAIFFLLAALHELPTIIKKKQKKKNRFKHDLPACHSLSHSPRSETAGLSGGLRCKIKCSLYDGAAHLPPLHTHTHTQKGTHPAPAVLLWSDSQRCAVSHGEELILLVGSGIG